MNFNNKSDREIWQYIRKNFDKLITIVAHKVAKRNYNLPIDANDLKSEFYIMIPKIMRKYNENINSSTLHLYISYQAFYYMMNIARSFRTKNNNLMNSFVSFNEIEKFTKVDNYYDGNLVNYDKPAEYKIDISSLTQLEKIVYNTYFLDNLSLKETSEKTHLSKWCIVNTISRVRKKLKHRITLD